MATADGYVLPKPGVPKTLGILSVIFSVILILIGVCGLGGMLLAPALTQFADTAIKEGQRKVEADKKAQTTALDDREKVAKTDEEKASIKAERDSLAAQPKVTMVDMKAMTGMLSDPTIMGFTYATYLSGLILHITLLVAGIGLIRLTPWGRTLGVYWAGLQIVQIVILSAVSFLYVQPKTQAAQVKMLAQAEADEKAGGAPNPGMAGVRMAQAMGGMAGPLAIGQVVVGSIFPAIMLILLNGAGAKAACRAVKPQGPADL